MCASCVIVVWAMLGIDSPALAADDNGQVPACAAAQCDVYQNVCESPSYYNLYYLPYDSNTYYDGSNGHPDCCGDDNQEYPTLCQVYNDGGEVCSGSTAVFCCNHSDSCVYNGRCYRNNKTAY